MSRRCRPQDRLELGQMITPRKVGISTLERLEALVNNPAPYAFAAVVPEQRRSDGGRPRHYPPYVWVLFDALLSVYGSRRQVEAELGQFRRVDPAPSTDQRTLRRPTRHVAARNADAPTPQRSNNQNTSHVGPGLPWRSAITWRDGSSPSRRPGLVGRRPSGGAGPSSSHRFCAVAPSLPTCIAPLRITRRRCRKWSNSGRSSTSTIR